jgi:hypothetical protein
MVFGTNADRYIELLSVVGCVNRTDRQATAGISYGETDQESNHQGHQEHQEEKEGEDFTAKNAKNAKRIKNVSKFRS